MISKNNFYLFFPICKTKEFKLCQLLESFKKKMCRCTIHLLRNLWINVLSRQMSLINGFVGLKQPLVLSVEINSEKASLYFYGSVIFWCFLRDLCKAMNVLEIFYKNLLKNADECKLECSIIIDFSPICSLKFFIYFTKQNGWASYL